MTKLIYQINPGYLYALTSAVLFGASTPAAKFLLSDIHPLFLAGIFYFGSGAGMLIILVARYFFTRAATDASLRREDLMYLGLATVCGGILAPVLLMVGLTKTSATFAALLLNFETVFTALTAWFLLKEHASRRIMFGMILIVFGAFILSWSTHFNMEAFSGIIFIVLACFFWAIDNNVTRHISSADPLKIVAIKSLVAGTTNITLAFILGVAFSNHFILIGMSAIIGFFSYGLSLVCFVLALRHIGTGRTSAYFSLAPFIGAILAVLFLNEPLTIQLILAGCLMAWGTWLHLTEHHEHEHSHERLIHEHSHVHDLHHQHSHQPDCPSGEPHSHLHEHKPLTHPHPHFPDIHHRHKHE